MFNAKDQPNSLFGEILIWLLAPLLALWPLSIALTNLVANNIANEPYDQLLGESLDNLSRLVQWVDGQPQIMPSRRKQPILNTITADEAWFQVRLITPDDKPAQVLAGDASLPLPPTDDADEPFKSGPVRYRDAHIKGVAVRVASLVEEGAPGQRLIIQVAQTRKQRAELAERIISGVLLPQFAIIPLAVLLVWLGLSRGLRPLLRLRARMASRRPGDLSPLDISRAPDELQPMVRSFNELLAQLESNLHAQQRFIADAAHQMKTPLAGLRMQAELAAQESDPAQLRKSVAQIATAAERAGRLITQLLTLARAEASHDKLQRFEAVDLQALAHEVTLDWFERARARQIDLGFEPAEWPLGVYGVPQLLAEMISNLLDNAIKYTPPGGKVTVRLLAEQHVMLEVEDNGAGIPQTERTRVFERFYRLLGTAADGSGLGLAICREIAELHRASIAIHSGAQGHGCRIVVTIPYATQSADAVVKT